MRRQIPFAVVIGLALALRVWGIQFGLPHSMTRPDEEAVYSIALKFFGRTLSPAFFDWPTLFMYAVGALFVVYFNVGRLGGWFPTEYSFLVAAAKDSSPFFLIARALSAVTGVMTVWTIGRLGIRLFDRTTGLMGALFLAVAMLHVRDSHFGVTDVAATWLICLSVLAAATYLHTGRRRDAMLSAVWAGLATSTKYNAAVVAFPGVWAIVASRASGERWHVRCLLIAAFGAVTVAMFVAGTPYAVFDYPHFRGAVTEVFGHLGRGHQLQAGPAWLTHLTSSLRYGVGSPLLATGIAGLAFAIWRDWRAGLLLALFPVVYFAAVGAGQSTFARYMVPVVPFLCLTAAYAAVAATRWIAESAGRPALAPALAWTTAVVLAAPTAVASVRIDWLLAQTDNRLIAAQGIHAQFPEGATLFQSGATYGHVQMRTADPGAADRYHEVTFDAATGVFHEPDGAEASPPQLIVVQESPLAYSDVADAVRRLLTERYQLERAFAALDISKRSVYDFDDAFYVPLAGFDGVVRPGPNLTIYRRR